MVLVGQENIKNLINSFNNLENFPRVVTIIGRQGYGKSHIVEYITDYFKISDRIIIESIDDVRNTISNAPNISHPTLVWVKSFESLNFRAKETLLKICEDIPNYLYIIIEVSNSALYEDRFLNRSFVIELSPYKKTELPEIVKLLKNDISNEDIDLMLSVLGSPKDFEKLLNSTMSVDDFNKFIFKVFNNIQKAQVFNAMKIFDNISSKADDKKLDFKLFINALYNISFRDFYKTNNLDSYKMLIACSEISNDLLYNSNVNKRALFDKFVFLLHKDI